MKKQWRVHWSEFIKDPADPAKGKWHPYTEPFSDPEPAYEKARGLVERGTCASADVLFVEAVVTRAAKVEKADP